MKKQKVVHKITWETTSLVEKPKRWYHRFLGYTPVVHHVHILEGHVHCDDGDTKNLMMDSLHNQIKRLVVDEDDPHFKSHNGIKFRRNVRDDLLED